MIVILNNGTRISLPREAVQDIMQKLAKGEATQWQCQIDTSNSEITSIINLKQVAAICRPDDIVDGLE